MTAADVTVVIVTHNSSDVLGGALRSVPPEADVVVVDNASTDNVGSIVAETRPSARLISLSENRGFGAGCNVGASKSSRPLLLFLNPDARIDRNSLEVLISRLACEEARVIVGPAILGSDGNTRFVCRRFSRPLADVLSLLPFVARRFSGLASSNVPPDDDVYRSGGHVDYLQGACLLVTRESYRAVGGFDERFFLYSEEEDLARRLLRRGVRCYYEPRASATHTWGTSTAKIGLTSVYHFYRSKVLLYAKHAGIARARCFSAAALGAISVEAVLLPVHRLSRSCPVRDLAWFRAAASGLWAGLR